MPFKRDYLFDVYSFIQIQKIFLGDINSSFLGKFRNFIIGQSDVAIVVESYYKCSTINYSLYLGILGLSDVLIYGLSNVCAQGFYSDSMSVAGCRRITNFFYLLQFLECPPLCINCSNFTSCTQCVPVVAILVNKICVCNTRTYYNSSFGTCSGMIYSFIYSKQISKFVRLSA